MVAQEKIALDEVADVVQGTDAAANTDVWFQTMLNLFPNPILLFELSTGKVLYVNSPFTRYAQPKARSLISVNILEAIKDSVPMWAWFQPSGEPVPLEQYPSARIVRGERFVQAELVLKVFATEKSYNMLVNGCTLPAACGYPEMGMVNFTDITLQVSQRRQVEQMLVLRDEFLTVASHELRTPLFAILLQSQLAVRTAQAKAVDPAVIKLLQAHERSVLRFSDLVGRLLDVSEMTGPRHLKLEELDLCQLVRDVLEAQDLTIKRLGVTIISRVPTEAIRGSWDRVRVEQIVTNLLANALKFGLQRPVEIDVLQRQAHVELRMRDYGIGVKSDDRRKIFERFQRAVGINYAGLGLGLWLSYENAVALGGSLWVEDPPQGSGSVFVLHLPTG